MKDYTIVLLQQAPNGKCTPILVGRVLREIHPDSFLCDFVGPHGNYMRILNSESMRTYTFFPSADKLRSFIQHANADPVKLTEDPVTEPARPREIRVDDVGNLVNKDI